jgi:hypothetical protein
LIEAGLLRGDEPCDCGETTVEECNDCCGPVGSPRAANPAQVTAPPRVNGRDIYEVANQLAGYVDEGTPEKLASFLLREGKAAADLADEIVRLTAAIGAGGQTVAEPIAWARDRVIYDLIHCDTPGFEGVQTMLSRGKGKYNTVPLYTHPAPSGRAVQDTRFTDRALPVKAMSGDVEDNRILRLHFRRPVTDDDRKSMCDALNQHQASLSQPHPADERVVEALRADINEFMGRLGPRWFLEQGWFPATVNADLSAKEGR